MQVRENEMNRDNIRFDGDNISLAATMVDKLTTTIDILYYLMGRREEEAFVIMLVSAQNIDVNTLLLKEKRNTDILFEIDKEESLYVLVCQGTKIDGGYYFGERVLRSMVVENGDDVYCVELEVKTTAHNIKYVVFKLIEMYIKTRQDKNEGELIFKTLH